MLLVVAVVVVVWMVGVTVVVYSVAGCSVVVVFIGYGNCPPYCRSQGQLTRNVSSISL